MNKLKKQIITFTAVLTVCAAGIGTTIAYFTDTETKTNVFTMGDLDIGLREPEWNPDPEDGTPDGADMFPGYTVYKNPTIKNLTSGKNGEESCYARIRLRMLDGTGKVITDKETVDLIRQMIYFDSSYNGTYDKKGGSTLLTEGRVPGYSLKELAAFPMVNPEFVLDAARSKDGSFVYNYMGADKDGLFDIGEESTLFTTVVVPTDWNQEQLAKIGDFRLDITAECIQNSGFETQEQAYQALDREAEDGTMQQISR